MKESFCPRLLSQVSTEGVPNYDQLQNLWAHHVNRAGQIHERSASALQWYGLDINKNLAYTAAVAGARLSDSPEQQQQHTWVIMGQGSSTGTVPQPFFAFPVTAGGFPSVVSFMTATLPAVTPPLASQSPAADVPTTRHKRNRTDRSCPECTKAEGSFVPLRNHGKCPRYAAKRERLDGSNKQKRQEQVQQQQEPSAGGDDI